MTQYTAYASATLHAPVEIVEDNGGDWVEVRTLAGGVGGWARAGKALTVQRAILHADDAETITENLAKADTESEPLTEPVDGDQYIEVLLRRQEAWREARAAYGTNYRMLPPLERFVRAADEPFVRIPESQPTQERKPRAPRRYRSAAELKAEHAALEERMAAVAHRSGMADRAAANLSPHSRSRAAASAGRRRFEAMDRDLAEYTRLRQRRDALTGKIARAEHREAAAKGN